MFLPTTLINLFFVPLLSLYLYYKRRGQPIAPSLELLFQYCLVVSFNQGLARIIAAYVSRLTGIVFSLDSAQYTLITILSAWLLFMVYVITKYLNLEVNVSNVEEHREDEKDQTHEIP